MVDVRSASNTGETVKRENALISLTLSLVVTLGGVAVIAVGWIVMYAANVRLSPDPVGDANRIVLAAADGDPELAGYIANGSKLYATTCIACHGQAGAGVKGNGKPLAGSKFVNSLDDEALLTFIKNGRLPTDPANTTGIAMPPKGGNPAFSEDDILDVISYLRTLPGNHFVKTETASK